MPGVNDDRKVFREFLEWWESLEDAGLRPFWTEPNLIFVNINLGTQPALAEVWNIADLCLRSLVLTDSFL